MVTVDSPNGSARVIQIVMTRDEWDMMVTIPFGDFDAAAESVKQAVLGQREQDPFLIYQNYDLHPSPTVDLPVDPDEELLVELAKEHPEGIGHWTAIDRNGTVHPFPEPPPER